MLRNDLLLRVFLFAGIFLLAQPVIELIALFVWVPLHATYWVGVIGAGLVALYLHTILFVAVQKSIIRQGELTTTVRWGLYLYFGFIILTFSFKLIDLVFYEPPYTMKIMIFTGEFFSRVKAMFLFVGTVYGGFILTRFLVNKIGLVSPLISDMPGAAPPSGSTVKNDINPVRSKGDKTTLHGSSNFTNMKDFNERYNARTDREVNERFENFGGYVILPNTLRYIDHTHMVTIAGAGQGKGTTAIIPNLLTRPQESWIVLDVKGENAAVTARFQRNCGQEVYILDPFDVQQFIKAEHSIKTSGFNPLTVGKYLPENEISDFAAMMAEMFIPEAGKSQSADNFWIDSARNVVKAYILHLLTDVDIPEQDRNLGKLYELLRLDQESEIELWVNMGTNPHTRYSANEIRSVAIKSEKTWFGILSEARRATAFLESPLIRSSLKSNDFDPMVLQESKATVYVILPERNLNTHKTWLRIVFGTTLKFCNFIAKRRVNFIMDEFPILGRMDDFLRAFSFGRGQRISCWIFAQSLSQIKDLYGEEGLNTFLSNAKLRQFFGMNDLYTRKFVSDLLGETTEIITTSTEGSTSGTSTSSSRSTYSTGGTDGSGDSHGSSRGSNEQVIKRPLMTAEEVGKLNKNFILLVDGDKYILPKIPYYNSPAYSGRYDRNPYVNQ